jgi:two-component system, OmpR family, sensor kinase
MFRTLRGRLLLSYLAVIATILLIISAALLVISVSRNNRVIPTLQQLAAISLNVRREMGRLRESGANLRMIEAALERVAAENSVRIAIARLDTQQITYDSDPSRAWQGISLSNVERPRGFAPTADPQLLAGRFVAPDGTAWLIYSQLLADPDAGRLLLIFARPEPAPLQFFRDNFLRPLCQGGLVAFLLAVLLAVLVAGWVARPLQQMAGAAEAVAEGNYSQELPLHGPDEVQRVARSFNAMTGRVKATQQAQRDFVANVSHDLKTPLTSIQGWSQALLDGAAASPEQQQQAAGIIHDEAERMGRMVTQLLDLARLESGQLELTRRPVDLSQILTAVHHNLTLRAQEQQITFTLETQPVPAITGDGDRLIQIFTNLADNALTHTSAGGRVHLSVRPHGDKAIEAIVQDTGRGIPADELSRIFERFYQVDKSRARGTERRGAGLGLAIVKELVEAHGGRIEARSTPGKGSAFIVRFPLGLPEGSTVTRRK